MECLARATDLKGDWETRAVAHSAPAGFLYPGCKRAASFPIVGDKELIMPSSLKTRSHSESESLNIFFPGITIEQIRKKISLAPKTQEEESGCETDSETLSQCGSSTDLAGDLQLSSEREKKSVRFADDCGQDLFDVRVMKEPSDYPPEIPLFVLRRLRGEEYDSEEERKEKEPESCWQVSFPQPASEYIKFREKLEKEKVSLENIVLKNDVGRCSGTVKVLNITFEKRVFIRLTTNSWASYIDRPTSYQTSSSKIYDTFLFDMEIPRESDKIKRIEFCICFVAGTTEYWDSNGGSNYALTLPSTKSTPAPITNGFGRHHYTDDAYKMEYTNWGSFAAWKNLSTDSPYW